MQLIADLHLHSRYARACSKAITIENLEKYSRLKGLNLLGTGDFTHPLWLKELKQTLIEDDSGILKTKTGMRFILQTEVANFFNQGNKPRKVHSLILAKNFEIVSQINELLEKHGKLASDGRPMLGKYSCIEMTEDLMEIDKSIEIIPAHIMTPYFGVLGSKSGFDSLEECYQEKTKYIHAVETGLSADPPMLWRLSFLDNISLVSGSDSHSYWPWRIGREATIFDIEPTYTNLIKALRTRHGLKATVEVDPSYGIYHFDGHRSCNISFPPLESIKHNNLCPRCHKPLTIGVMHRIEELATRKEGYRPANVVPYYSLLPLAELIALSNKSALMSKKNLDLFYRLINRFGSEFNVLLNVDKEDLIKESNEKFASIILKNRSGKIYVKPGYDGLYGVPVIDGESVSLEKLGDNDAEIAIKTKIQKSLADF